MLSEPTIILPPDTKIPDHIAMILDGNRRWARARGKEPWEGHRAGYQAIKKVADSSRKLGVHTFTVWGFSTENWERSEKEISAIMDLLRVALDDMESDLHTSKTRVVHLGRKDRLPKDLMDHITRLENVTRNYTQHVFNLALDYGGRDELTRAVKKIVASGVPAETIDEKLIAANLDTSDQPYPNVDLFIRTSGEQRTSGLLPWQMVYAEFFWENNHLPDFTPAKLAEAIIDYSRRRRRFGGNDIEEHLKFNPKLLARLELDWRKGLATGLTETRLRDLVIKYVKEQFGLSKELAITAGIHMANALLHGKREDWKEAKKALMQLNALIKKNVGLALEPELVADLQIKFWQNKGSEGDLRQMYSETYRFSDFQATKSAHLAYLADGEIKKHNYSKAQDYLEKFYSALKERVA